MPSLQHQAQSSLRCTSCSSSASCSRPSSSRIASSGYFSSGASQRSIRSWSCQCRRADADITGTTEREKCPRSQDLTTASYQQYQSRSQSSPMKCGQTRARRNRPQPCIRHRMSGTSTRKCLTHHQRMASGEAACEPIQSSCTGKCCLRPQHQRSRHRHTRSLPDSIISSLEHHQATGLGTVQRDQGKYGTMDRRPLSRVQR